jgi:putative nucleotidyltransferase with HDIG domain
LAFAILITFMFPKGKSFEYADLTQGQVWDREEVIATFTFAVYKTDEEYQNDIQIARSKVEPVFVRDENVANTQVEALSSFTQKITTRLKGKVTTPEDIRDLFEQEEIFISDDNYYLLLNAFESNTNAGKSNNTGPRVATFEKISAKILEFVTNLYASGIINVLKEDLPASTTKLSVKKENAPEAKEQLQFYLDIKEAKDALLNNIRDDAEIDEVELKVAYTIGEHFLQANIMYDEEETRNRQDEAQNAVPRAKDQVLDGERIIEDHEKLTQAHIDKLRSFAIAKAENDEQKGFWIKLKPQLGKFFLVLIILSILSIYLITDRPAIFNDRKKLLLIALCLFFIAALTFIANSFALSSYIVPITAVSLIITIFFDTRVGLIVTMIAALLVGALRGNEYAITYSSAFVGAIAVLTVRKVRTRNWIIRSGLFISAAYIFVILVNGLIAYAEFSAILGNWWIGILNGFLTPGIAYLLIIILESVFDLTTDMTLLELSDFNHPLLRQLHLEAPGTYHHCYLVGMLAETAAEALGGNALLARVGSYYHDIGKLEKPEYFVENQTKGRNPQEKLAPTMSSLILSNHVRRGGEIAREYGLPKEIEDFIYQHHGTSLMSFFYQKALEQSTDDSVSENEFRYPGPRPQTRETAIVMMADAIEAASRTLKDPTPSRIKGLVEQIIDERFKSGELDDSPLTLRDLSKISLAFQKVLNGRFHGRVEYPKADGSEKRNGQ